MQTNQTPLTEADIRGIAKSQLFQTVRGWRRQHAANTNRPAYLVLSDRQICLLIHAACYDVVRAAWLFMLRCRFRERRVETS